MSNQFDFEADFVVLGAGSAGSVLADRLSEDGRCRVLVVEAGPLDHNPFIHIPAGFLRLIQNPQLNWMMSSEQVEGLGGRSVQYAQGRMAGGTGSMNGMLYVRSFRAEHEVWEAQGCAGWSFDETLPFYQKAENRQDAADMNRPLHVRNFLEVHPLTEAFVTASQQIGLRGLASHNGVEREGVAQFEQTRKGRFRGGPGQTYLRRARRRSNVVLLTDTLCQRILFDGRRAIGALLTRGGRQLNVKARREVIVSNGTLRSPQLLQVSGIGPAALLSNLGIQVVADRPTVGGNLRDHFYARLTQRVAGLTTLNERSRGHHFARELFRYIFLGRGLLTLGASSAAAFARSRASLPGPDLQLSFAPGSFQPGTYELEKQSGMTIALYHSYPESQGRVTARSPDTRDKPIIAPNYLSVSSDVNALVAGIKLARRIFAAPCFRSIATNETLPGADVSSDDELASYARQTGVPGFHLVGTCRMGGEEGSVVDPTLKVRGVDGLRVVDASIMPTCTSGNTNAPTIMVAEKGASMILEEARVLQLA